MHFKYLIAHDMSRVKRSRRLHILETPETLEETIQELFGDVRCM